MMGYTNDDRTRAYTATYTLGYMHLYPTVDRALQDAVDSAARECIAAGIPENDAVAAIHARLRDTLATCAGELAARAIARYADAAERDTPRDAMRDAFDAHNR